MNRRKTTACLLALASMWMAAAPVAAHHGWGYYDTSGPLYLRGQISAVDWRNPHPSVVLQVAEAALPASWTGLPVPPELRALGFEATLARARPAAQAGAWMLDLAPINRLESWGMPRPPRVGDALVAIAFPSCTQPRVARPVLIVLDGIGVRQQSVALPAGCSSR
ncbi:DUF6152 family protein [Xylophilus sp. GW821-FHT01B05]